MMDIPQQTNETLSKVERTSNHSFKTDHEDLGRTEKLLASSNANTVYHGYAELEEKLKKRFHLNKVPLKFLLLSLLMQIEIQIGFLKSSSFV